MARKGSPSPVPWFKMQQMLQSRSTTFPVIERVSVFDDQNQFHRNTAFGIIFKYVWHLPSYTIIENIHHLITIKLESNVSVILTQSVTVCSSEYYWRKFVASVPASSSVRHPRCIETKLASYWSDPCIQSTHWPQLFTQTEVRSSEKSLLESRRPRKQSLMSQWKM